MKKFSIAFIASFLFFTACENTQSSTVGTYEYDSSTTDEHEEGHGKEGHLKGKSALPHSTHLAPADTLQTGKKVDGVMNGHKVDSLMPAEHSEEESH